MCCNEDKVSIAARRASRVVEVVAAISIKWEKVNVEPQHAALSYDAAGNMT